MVRAGSAIGGNDEGHGALIDGVVPNTDRTIDLEPHEDAVEPILPFTAMRLLVGTGMADIPKVREAVKGSRQRAKDAAATDDPDAFQAFVRDEILHVVRQYVGEGMPANAKVVGDLAQQFVNTTIPFLKVANEKRISIPPHKDEHDKRRHAYPQLVIPKAKASETVPNPGAYRLAYPVGKGGFGSVWKARDGAHSLALKLLDVQTPQTHARFDREARISDAAGPSAALPAFYQYNGHSMQRPHGTIAPYIASEFVAGQTLDRFLKEKHDPKVLRFLFYRIVQKLDDLRGQLPGFVHRDMKPENIMVTFSPNPDVMILDLGMARVDSEGIADDEAATVDQADLTQDGAFMGTPAWMSPEEFRGQWKLVGAKSDLWSTAAIFFKAIQGALPNITSSQYKERKDHIKDLLIFLSKERQKPIASELWNAVYDFDPDFAALLQDVLQVDQDARPDPDTILQRAKELAPSVIPSHTEPAPGDTSTNLLPGADTPLDPVQMRRLIEDHLTNIKVRKISNTRKVGRKFLDVTRHVGVRIAAAVTFVLALGATAGYVLSGNSKKSANDPVPSLNATQENPSKHPAMLNNVDMQHPENTTLALLGGARLQPKTTWKFGEASFGLVYDCNPDQLEPMLKHLYSSDPDLWESIKARLTDENHINGSHVRIYAYVTPKGKLIDVCDHTTLVITPDGHLSYFLSDKTGGHPKTSDPTKLKIQETVDQKRIRSGRAGRFTSTELLDIVNEIPDKAPPGAEDPNDITGALYRRLNKTFRIGIQMYGPKKS